MTAALLAGAVWLNIATILKLKERSTAAQLSKAERRKLKKAYKTELVKRSHLLRIIAAWFITVAVSALLAALMSFAIRGMCFPDDRTPQRNRLPSAQGLVAAQLPTPNARSLFSCASSASRVRC